MKYAVNVAKDFLPRYLPSLTTPTLSVIACEFLNRPVSDILDFLAIRITEARKCLSATGCRTDEVVIRNSINRQAEIRLPGRIAHHRNRRRPTVTVRAKQPPRKILHLIEIGTVVHPLLGEGTIVRLNDPVLIQ